MSKHISPELRREIRKQVRNGKSKYRVAKEMKLPQKIVYYHTRDYPSGGPGRSEIRGKTLELLKELLENGHVHCRHRCSPNLHTLQKHFPAIKRAQIYHKSIYYLEDKNREAIRALLDAKRSKVINYQDLANMSKVFDVSLSKREKKEFIGKKRTKN